MKVNVSNLRPNPYRKIDKYPIRRDKVEALKLSIDDTGFWDNILARPKPEHSEVTCDDIYVTDRDGYESWEYGPDVAVGPESEEDPEDNEIIINERGKGGHVGYQQPIIQIAYGHHRLIAIQELGIDEVNIPVKDIDDATMIKIMANENMANWETNTSVINETVLTVRDYLAAGGEKHIGEEEILAFLGSSWGSRTVRDALATIRDDEVDREAVEVFETPTHASTFRRELKHDIYKGLVPEEEQKEFAEEVKQTAIETDGELTSKGIKQATYDVVKKRAAKTNVAISPIRKPTAEEYTLCGTAWYKALRILQGIVVRPSDLGDEDREKLNKLVTQIGAIVEEWNYE